MVVHGEGAGRLFRSLLVSCALIIVALGCAAEATNSSLRSSNAREVTTGSSSLSIPAPVAVTEAPERETPLLPPVPVSSASFAEVMGRPAVPVPTALRIGELTIDAPVVPVGVDEQGAMEIPAADEVGWYRHGPAAGQPGSTVLAAHVDYNGREGVFFELSQLDEGAEVEVGLDDGSQLSYRVVSSAFHDKDELPMDEVFARTGDEVLTLITCGGAFDASARSYEENLVVVAVPIS